MITDLLQQRKLRESLYLCDVLKRKQANKRLQKLMKAPQPPTMWAHPLTRALFGLKNLKGQAAPRKQCVPTPVGQSGQVLRAARTHARTHARNYKLEECGGRHPVD